MGGGVLQILKTENNCIATGHILCKEIRISQEYKHVVPIYLQIF